MPPELLPCAYAALRWVSQAWLAAALGTSVLSLGVESDSFPFGERSVKHARSIPTIVTRVPTIPQYPHDIYHLLACRERESFRCHDAVRYAHRDMSYRILASSFSSRLRAAKDRPIKKTIASMQTATTR